MFEDACFGCDNELGCLQANLMICIFLCVCTNTPIVEGWEPLFTHKQQRKVFSPKILEIMGFSFIIY